MASRRWWRSCGARRSSRSLSAPPGLCHRPGLPSRWPRAGGCGGPRTAVGEGLGGCQGRWEGKSRALTSPRRGLAGAPGEASPRPVLGPFRAGVVVGRSGTRDCSASAAGGSRELPHGASVALVRRPSHSCPALSCPNLLCFSVAALT